MKTGIYISGLGQSFQNETVEKYAERLMNEMSYATNGIVYELNIEKVNYSRDRESTCVTIFNKNNATEIYYKLYDFKYHKLLTEKFNSYALITKNLWLLVLVFHKTPLLITRLFNPASYNRPLQTLYLFFIFFIISGAVLLMFPATITLLLSVFDQIKGNEIILQIKKFIGVHNIPIITRAGFEYFSKIIIAFTALLLLLVPNANNFITTLATEFVCANDYMEHGVQKQLVQGNLEILVEYITEHEADPKIHFHAYSFGSILALDYVYPYTNKVSRNATSYCEALITIGNPFEFVNSYYPKFFMNRKLSYGDQLQWINIYSVADALATNFRHDAKIADAEFGIDPASKKPVNINYEVVALDKIGIADFFMLYSLKAHGMYWDSNPEGQSCLGLLYEEMQNRNLI